MNRTLVQSKGRIGPRDISAELAFIRSYNQPAAPQSVDPDEAAYLQWKRANGLDKPLSRAEYDTLFHIYF